MNTLVSLGTSVAFVYSAYATVWPANGRQVYFDAVLLIVGFLLLGKALEARAKRRALAALDSLSRLRPVTARRIRDKVETIVPLAEIQPGDSVLVLPESASRSTPPSSKAAPPWTSRCSPANQPSTARTRRQGSGRLAQLRRRRHLPG